MFPGSDSTGFISALDLFLCLVCKKIFNRSFNQVHLDDIVYTFSTIGKYEHFKSQV